MSLLCPSVPHFKRFSFNSVLISLAVTLHSFLRDIHLCCINVGLRTSRGSCSVYAIAWIESSVSSAGKHGSSPLVTVVLCFLMCLASCATLSTKTCAWILMMEPSDNVLFSLSFQNPPQSFLMKSCGY